MAGLLRSALVSFASLTVLTGIAYPVVVGALAESLFPFQAHGSLIRDGEQVLGSTWIGQPFTGPGFFWSRPSATRTVAYDAAASSGSNLGPSNPLLYESVAARMAELRAAHASLGPVPVDLVTTSASGLDPHISPAAAEYQLARVARVRGLPEESIRRLVAVHTEGRTLGLLGEPRVSVLSLNLDLERLDQRAAGE